MTLKEYYLQQKAIFQTVLDAPKPNYLDVEKVSDQDIEDYITNYTIANDHKNQIHRNIHTALKTLTDDQLKAVFRKIKGPSGDERCTEDTFIQRIRSNDTEVHMNAAFFGSTIEQMMDVYAEALGPEKVNEIINTPIQPHPMSPDYKESKVYSPYETEIQALRDKFTHTADAAKNAENEKLLQKVSATLQNVKPEVLNAFDGPRSNANVPGYENYDNIVGRRVNVRQVQGLQTLGDGQFKDLVKPAVGGGGAPDFSLLSEDQYPNPMPAEQAQALDKLSADPKVGLSEDTRQAVRELSQRLDELHFERVSGAPLSGQIFPLHKPEKPDDMYYPNEEGYKYYAFRPVAHAKQMLIAAVKRGDLEEVRQAQEAYEQAEASTDKAIEILKSDKLNPAPIFSPNVESTRASTGDMPEKFALDTTNQKKLNSLYIGYATLKSAGLTLEELCKDPAKTAKTLGKQLIAAGGLNSRQGSIGAVLQNGMKGRYTVGTADTALMTAWVGLDAAMTRALSGIAGMEKDPKRSAEFLAAFHLGLREANLEIQKEIRRYETMSKVCTDEAERYAGMRGTLYQNAAIRPEAGENALNLEEMIDSFDKPDQVLEPGLSLKNAKPEQIRYSWQDEMDAANAYASGDAAYNWVELADRNQKVLADAAREELISGSYNNQFVPDQYLLHAFSAQNRLAKNAAAKGESSQEFQAFRESLKNTWKLARNQDVKAILKMGAALMDDPMAYDFLQTGKDDQLVKTDSEEYKTMKKSLAKIQKVKELLTGGNPMKLEKLYGSDFCKDLEKAKQDAFEYVRLKTKNGSKSSFHYESGRRRFEEGMANFRKLAKLQDDLGLRSPAQKAYEDARMELMLKRGNPKWLYGTEGKTVMAKMLYAKSFVDAKIPAEHQTAAFRPEAFRRGVDSILNKRLHRFENPAELETLADQAVEHSGVFKQAARNMAAQRLEAYDRAMAEPRLKQAKLDCAKGFALDKAAEALQINHAMQNYASRNPALQAKAEEIMKDPDFQETIRRLTAGKTVQQIRKLHDAAALDGSSSGGMEFEKNEAALKYEKRCAAVAADATLRRMNEGREPTQEEIDKYAAAIRKDQRFQAFMREKESKLADGAAYNKAINALNFEDSRNQFLMEMAQKVTEPIPQQPASIENQPLAAPQSLQQKHGPEPIQGAPVQAGPTSQN
ncbi:MAG: hypothetical protein IJK24_01465 [Oscillospiraceae bacterium]|nr:hypothetical protein [Oscillospiraceae bacterium]MBQ6159593.1 hypothetical protein [Oscillospiraceae bacterium]